MTKFVTTACSGLACGASFLAPSPPHQTYRDLPKKTRSQETKRLHIIFVTPPTAAHDLTGTLHASRKNHTAPRHALSVLEHNLAALTAPHLRGGAVVAVSRTTQWSIAKKE